MVLMQTRIIGAVLAVLTLATFTTPPAVATTDDADEQWMSAMTTAAECWGPHHANTLRHIVIHNGGPGAARYRVKYRIAGHRPQQHSGRLPVGRGVMEGVVIRPGVKLDYLDVTTKHDGLIYHALDVYGLARCEKHSAR